MTGPAGAALSRKSITAPAGGFGATGSSGGSGVSVPTLRRTRYVAAGGNRVTSAAAAAAVRLRSGEMSSRIQNDRPCVPTTRSFWWTTRSRTDVAGMFCRSGCQSSPSLNDTNTARSVPAKSSPLRTGSSRTALTGALSGSPRTISFQVFPPSWVR